MPDFPETGSLSTWPSTLDDFVDKFRTEANRFDPLTCGKPSIFPQGACGWACEMLGPLLAEHGFGTWQIVRGRAPRHGPIWMGTHCWLEKDGVVVDPTIDQFEGNEEFQGIDLSIISAAPSSIANIFHEVPGAVREIASVRVESFHRGTEQAYENVRTALSRRHSDTS